MGNLQHIPAQQEFGRLPGFVRQIPIFPGKTKTDPYFGPAFIFFLTMAKQLCHSHAASYLNPDADDH
jgi:hypothetical protein